MSNSRKKVIVRRFAGDTVPGYLPLAAFVRLAGGTGPIVELLDLSGRIVELALKDIKTVSYVRDFNLGDTLNPERLTRRAFLARPRNEGIWARITFRSPEGRSADHRSSEVRPSDARPLDQIEGLAASDLSFIDSLIQDHGIHITPPDVRSNTQRIFIPRLAIADLQLLAVITNPSRVKVAPRPTAEQLRKELQENLFQAPTPPNTRPN